MATQVHVDGDTTDVKDDSGVIASLVPEHIRADIAVGNTPEAVQFDNCPMACVEICDFNELCNAAGPLNTFTLVQSFEDAIDQTIAKFPTVFKVNLSTKNGNIYKSNFLKCV